MLKKWFLLGLVIFGFLCADYAYMSIADKSVNVKFHTDEVPQAESVDSAAAVQMKTAIREVASQKDAKKRKNKKEVPWGRVNHSTNN